MQNVFFSNLKDSAQSDVMKTKSHSPARDKAFPRFRTDLVFLKRQNTLTITTIIPKRKAFNWTRYGICFADTIRGIKTCIMRDLNGGLVNIW